MVADTQIKNAPLADRMRPLALDDYIGQDDILGQDKPLRQSIEHGSIHSMVFWGPPGTGKTSLARLLTQACDVQFLALSAVLGKVQDIRTVMQKAEDYRHSHGKDTVLFVDEVHRFNKSQQDAFLPYIEDGTITFVGATTENPSFALNNALLSRLRVYVLKSLGSDEVLLILKRALKDEQYGFGARDLHIDDEVLGLIANSADGDARRGLNILEMAVLQAKDGILTVPFITEVLKDGSARRFDKGGEEFYNQISALHKAIRGSAVDASLYWFARMIDGGCDPFYIARRLIRIASEDIGNADPKALQIAINAWEAQQYLGSPEGELALAQAVVYLASTAKSNAVYLAYKAVMDDARSLGSKSVPLHLRNAPTQLMKKLNYGKRYRYAHNEPDAYAAGENYFPDDTPQRNYYKPVARGLEIKIGDKLARLKKLDREYKAKL